MRNSSRWFTVRHVLISPRTVTKTAQRINEVESPGGAILLPSSVCCGYGQRECGGTVAAPSSPRPRDGFVRQEPPRLKPRSSLRTSGRMPCCAAKATQ